MPTDVEAEIRARLEQFATRLTALIQQSAMSSVEDAFGGSAPARRGRGGRGAAVAAVRAPRAKKGQKRDPGLLEALTEKLGSFIAKNPGLRIEQIGQTLGVATKDLALPVKKLIAAKRVSTKGQKRATTYFAGGGRGGKRGHDRRPPGGKFHDQVAPIEPSREAAVEASAPQPAILDAPQPERARTEPPRHEKPRREHKPHADKKAHDKPRGRSSEAESQVVDKSELPAFLFRKVTLPKRGPQD